MKFSEGLSICRKLNAPRWQACSSRASNRRRNQTSKSSGRRKPNAGGARSSPGRSRQSGRRLGDEASVVRFCVDNLRIRVMHRAALAGAPPRPRRTPLRRRQSDVRLLESFPGSSVHIQKFGALLDVSNCSRRSPHLQLARRLGPHRKVLHHEASTYLTVCSPRPSPNDLCLPPRGRRAAARAEWLLQRRACVDDAGVAGRLDVGARAERSR